MSQQNTPLASADIDRLAAFLHDARREARDVEKITDEHPGLSIADAYAIQRKLFALEMAQGARLAGRKMGLTSPAKMKQMGVDKPIHGFLLAEEDLKLRGGGELLGTRQSGEEGFRIADLEQTQRMAQMAQDDARLLLDRDGGLTGERGEAARLLLYLMERDWGVQLLRGG